MKSQRGITLTSLVIYVIGLFFVIALMNSFLTYFTKNTSEIALSDSSDEQYMSFLSYLTKDNNSNDVIFKGDVVTTLENGSNPDINSLAFLYKDGTQHRYILVKNSDLGDSRYSLCLISVNKTGDIEKVITLCNNVSINENVPLDDNNIKKVFNYNNDKNTITYNITIN